MEFLGIMHSIHGFEDWRRFLKIFFKYFESVCSPFTFKNRCLLQTSYMVNESIQQGPFYMYIIFFKNYLWYIIIFFYPMYRSQSCLSFYVFVVLFPSHPIKQIKTSFFSHSRCVIVLKKTYRICILSLI